MARKTYHYVDTYSPGARGKLSVSDHREFKTPELAVQRANYIADKVHGVMAFSIDADPEWDVWGDPKMLVTHGSTPED